MENKEFLDKEGIEILAEEIITRLYSGYLTELKTVINNEINRVTFVEDRINKRLTNIEKDIEKIKEILNSKSE